MLETKPQPARSGTAAPRFPARPTPSASGAAAARPLPPRRPAPADAREAERAARLATDRQTARSRRASRSESRLLTWAVSSAVVVCGLLVLYLAAYAHLTTLGIEQARAQHDFREKWQQNQMLRAQLASLKNPDRIAAQAVRLGLTRDSQRVDYITPPRPASVSPPPAALPAPGDGARQEAFSADVSGGDTPALSGGDEATIRTGAGGEAGPQGTDSSGPTSNDNTAARHD